jgi:hypothetical protein
MTNRERPIIFSGESVRAILDGRKTQTRRVINWQRVRTWQIARECFGADGRDFADEETRKIVRVPWRSGKDIAGNLIPPFGFPGARLWVRETWQYDPAGQLPLIYRATSPAGYAEMPGYLWRSPIFMPHRASRLTLEIQSIRVERLQEISEDDACAEGFSTNGLGCTTAPGALLPCVSLFAEGWDQVSGKRASRESNPWVWVLTFKRIKP